jgi:hypothetical protein
MMTSNIGGSSVAEPTKNRGRASIAKRFRVNPDAKFLTTGDVAILCDVAPRTVAKWCDSGKLESIRIPSNGHKGHRDRRIARSEVVRFLNEHGIPLDGLSSKPKALLIGCNPSVVHRIQEMVAGDLDVKSVASVFAAGREIQSWQPKTIVIDSSVGLSAISEIASESKVPFGTVSSMIALIYETDKADNFKKIGCTACLDSPINMDKLDSLLRKPKRKNPNG